MLLMKQARESLKDKWSIAVGVCFLYILITLVAGAPKGIGPVLAILIKGPMLFGLVLFSLALSRGKEVSIEQLFSGFNDFLRTLTAYLLMCLFTLLWLLLLIVPGVIAALAYSQTFFILTEDKNISARDAIKKSKAMMNGHKEKLFFLGLRFFGWFVLGALTMGIGFLWILPYFYVTMAKFYDDVSGKTIKSAA